jgi:glycerophosphoryl diester phosphodiesterase
VSASRSGVAVPLRFRRGERLIRIAHRGASQVAPENTHAAFAAALALGVDAIELDCQLSADGELVVIHDETLDRTTSGRGPVAARTWQELATLDAGGWRGEQFRGQRIPRLADVLEQVRGRAALNVEIKSARDLGVIEPRLAALVHDAGAADWVLFSSFHELALRAIRAAAPWAHVGILRSRRPASRALALAHTLAAACIVPGRHLVGRRLVKAAHAAGLGVWVWTVNEPAEMRRLVTMGVDALFSDCPERFDDVEVARPDGAP